MRIAFVFIDGRLLAKENRLHLELLAELLEQAPTSDPRWILGSLVGSKDSLSVVIHEPRHVTDVTVRDLLALRRALEAWIEDQRWTLNSDSLPST